MAYQIAVARAGPNATIGWIIGKLTAALEGQRVVADFVQKGDVIEMKKVRSSHGAYITQEEWLLVNKTVNDVLDAEQVIADVWSTPFAVRGRLWIRRGEKRIA